MMICKFVMFNVIYSFFTRFLWIRTYNRFFFQKAQKSLKNVTEEESNIRFAYITAKDVKSFVGKNNFIVRPQNGANFEYGTSEKVSIENLLRGTLTIRKFNLFICWTGPQGWSCNFYGAFQINVRATDSSVALRK